MTSEVIPEEKIPSFKQHQKAHQSKESVCDVFNLNRKYKSNVLPNKKNLTKPSEIRLTSSQSAYDLRPIERYASFRSAPNRHLSRVTLNSTLSTMDQSMCTSQSSLMSSNSYFIVDQDGKETPLFEQ